MKYTFTYTTFTVNGKTFPAEYSITPTGIVFLFVTVADGKTERIRIDSTHEQYANARAAALEADKPAAKHPETIPTDAAPAAVQKTRKPAAKRPETVSPDAAPAAVPPIRPAAEQPATKPKRPFVPVPEKTFIGDSITGKGWKIYFDGAKKRTRVIFDSKPTDAARASLEKAGFYFSSAMNSWNKKLTFKAYRAAQALSAELTAIYA